MKVLKPGSGQKGWSTEKTCTGTGNGGGGCGAVLLVEQPDLYKTFRHCRDEADTFVTFSCSECGVETDITNVPSNIQSKLPAKNDFVRNSDK